MEQLIEVSTRDLKTASQFIRQQAEQFQRVYGDLYNDINDMENRWKGKDYDAFKREMDDYIPELKKMHQLMMDYSTYLDTTARGYDSVQDDLIKNAGNIVKSK